MKIANCEPIDFRARDRQPFTRNRRVLGCQVCFGIFLSEEGNNCIFIFFARDYTNEIAHMYDRF